MGTRLPFALARAQIDHQAVALLKVHRGPPEVESLVHIKTEWTSDKKRPVHDRVESSSMRVPWVRITAGIETGELEPEPIFVDR